MKGTVLIFGAGATGRGHLGALCHEEGWALTFVERDRDLVNALASAGSYAVELVGTSPRTLLVEGFRMLDVADVEGVAEEFARAAVVLTAVLPENLEAIAPALAEGIRRRAADGRGEAVNVIACENMQRGSTALRAMVERQLLPEERKSALSLIGFPDAMISRIVPRPKGDGLRLVAEDYNEWVVRKRDFVGEKPGLAAMDLVSDFDARLERKLFMHNGAHAVCAYLAFQRRHRYIHEAVADAAVARAVVGALDEIGEVVRRRHRFSCKSIDEYKRSFVERGKIAELADEVARVVRNPARKLAGDERLLGPAALAETYGLERENIVLGIAAALAYRCEEDAQAREVCRLIEEKGARGALAVLSGLSAADPLCREVEQAFHDAPWTKW